MTATLRCVLRLCMAWGSGFPAWPKTTALKCAPLISSSSFSSCCCTWMTPTLQFRTKCSVRQGGVLRIGAGVRKTSYLNPLYLPEMGFFMWLSFPFDFNLHLGKSAHLGMRGIWGDLSQNTRLLPLACSQEIRSSIISKLPFILLFHSIYHWKDREQFPLPNC